MYLQVEKYSLSYVVLSFHTNIFRLQKNFNNSNKVLSIFKLPYV